MNFRPIFYINGILLLILSFAMFLPAMVDLAAQSQDWKVFAGAQIITAFVGFSLLFMNRQKKFHLTLRETFLLTSFSWLFMVAFGALPFVFSELNLSYTKAFFEAMSGITTTGATVITGLDNLPHGILLWRCMLHWIGGVGFLIIALAVLPMLQISGMQIFKTQSFQIEKIMPTAEQLAIAICAIYVGLTFIGAIAFFMAGMTPFDAICHAMSALATGGFANYDASIGYYQSPTIDTLAILLMLMGALPFILYLRAIRGDTKTILHDSQVRTFLGIVFFLSLMTASYLIGSGQFGFIDALRNGFFMIVTIITTTGFASGDYTLWGPLAVGTAFLTTFIGSCSGSTAGGIKIFRLQILWLMLQQQVRKLMTPHGIFPVHYNGKTVEADLQASVAGFIFIYMVTWLVTGMLLQITGLDFVSAYTGAITALSNVGPGVGSVIGPAGNFSSLNDSSIWILSAAMLLGRLEFLTILVILTPRFWRN